MQFKQKNIIRLKEKNDKINTMQIACIKSQYGYINTNMRQNIKIKSTTKGKQEYLMRIKGTIQ